MDRAIRNLISAGASLELAVGAATRAPARLLGRPDLGELRVGGAADIVVLDGSLEVRRTLVAGREVYYA
jgi:N-acetylglucosamine-6-phosphate deacetylase